MTTNHRTAHRAHRRSEIIGVNKAGDRRRSGDRDECLSALAIFRWDRERAAAKGFKLP